MRNGGLHPCTFPGHQTGSKCSAGETAVIGILFLDAGQKNRLVIVMVGRDYSKVLAL